MYETQKLKYDLVRILRQLLWYTQFQLFVRWQALRMNAHIVNCIAVDLSCNANYPNQDEAYAVASQ